MTLKEFIEDLTEQMKGSKWQNREVIFSTSDKTDMEFLSIYTDDEDPKNVFIDIGEEDE